MIKQNIVFVENKAGSLKRVTGLLANNNINIYGFACFDAPEFAIFRMICDILGMKDHYRSEVFSVERSVDVVKTYIAVCHNFQKFIQTAYLILHIYYDCLCDTVHVSALI